AGAGQRRSGVPQLGVSDSPSLATGSANIDIVVSATFLVPADHPIAAGKSKNTGAMTAPLAVVEPRRFLPRAMPINTGLQLDSWWRELAHYGDQATIRKPGGADLEGIFAIGQARLALPMTTTPPALVSRPAATAPRRP